MPNNVMIDIETLDTTETATILSIGACCGEKEFYSTISINSQPTRTQSEATINWWNTKVNPEIKKETWSGTKDLLTVLQELKTWLQEIPSKQIWSKGSFDIVILENAFMSYAIKPPWFFTMINDFRTVTKLAPDFYKRIKTASIAHNALDDAKNQYRELILLLDKFSK